MSLSGGLLCDVSLAPEYDLACAATGTYRSAVALQVAPSVGTTTIQHSSSYEIMNLNMSRRHEPWHATFYVTNLLDRREILAPPPQPNELDNLTNDYLVNPPREMGIRVGYAF